MYRSVWLVLAAVSALMMSAAAPRASSAQEPEWMKCHASNDTPEVRIAACTAGLRDNVEGGKLASVFYRARAAAYLETNDYASALADYDEVVRAEPDFYFAYWARALVHIAKGDHASAIADYDSAIKLEADEPDLYLERGNAFATLKNYDRAIADYTSALAANPKHAEAYANRGLVNAIRKEHVRAVADFEEALRLDPNSFSLHETRGFANFLIGNFDVARDSFRRAAEKKPAEAYYVIWTYLADSRAGNTAAAGQLRVDASRFDPTAWPYPVIELYLGAQTAQAVLAAAKNADERCEAQFYVGQRLLLQAAKEDARALLRTVAETCRRDFYEYDGAIADLKRLQQ